MTLRSILAIATFVLVCGLYVKTGPEWRAWASHYTSWSIPWAKADHVQD